MICIFCGLSIERQSPIPTSIEFKPPVMNGIEGLDTLTAKYCHQSCYAAILKNSALASEEASKSLTEAMK